MNKAPRSRDEEIDLTSSDERFVETLRSRLDPGERTPVQRAAFRARLEERLEERSRFSWQPLVWTASAAVAGLALWFAFPETQHTGDGTEPIPVAREGSGLLAYAYYETDYLANADGQSDFLSEEYQAIAAAFDVP